MTEKEVEVIMGRPGDFRLNNTDNDLTLWFESQQSSVAISFSDMSNCWIDFGAREGKMWSDDGGNLQLRDDPPLGLRKAYQTFKRMFGL